MKIPVYKSLDKTSSLFGIQGTYLYFVVGGFVLAAILGFGVVGGMIAGSSIIGTLATAVLGAVAYFIVMTVQGNFTERELKRKLTSLKMPDFMVLRSSLFRHTVYSRKAFYEQNDKKK